MAPLVPDLTEEQRNVRKAMWSVYHHSFSLQTLRRSLVMNLPTGDLSRIAVDEALQIAPEASGRMGQSSSLHTVRRDLVDMPTRKLGPIPLKNALEIVTNATGPAAHTRRIRVLDRIGLAGFVSAKRIYQLQTEAEKAKDESWQERISAVQLQVKNLCDTLKIDYGQISEVPPRFFRMVLYSLMPTIAANCEVLYPTCHTCYDPVDELTGRPITTVTSTALVSATPQQLAKVFDPRSWGTCFDNFQTQRVNERDNSGNYPPFSPDNDPIGKPWNPANPHLCFERVTLESEGYSNVFENILRVTSFVVVDDSHARLDFDLRESRKLTIPALAIDLNQCVTVDRGHLEATAVAGPTGGLWSKLEVVKRIQYVDVTVQGSNDPFGLEPGELLNYYAPAVLCLWLEDVASGAVCCRV